MKTMTFSNADKPSIEIAGVVDSLIINTSPTERMMMIKILNARSHPRFIALNVDMNDASVYHSVIMPKCNSTALVKHFGVLDEVRELYARFGVDWEVISLIKVNDD